MQKINKLYQKYIFTFVEIKFSLAEVLVPFRSIWMTVCIVNDIALEGYLI